MIKLKFNQNFKTIQMILNKSHNIKIFKSYILINPTDLESITKILDGQYLKYKAMFDQENLIGLTEEQRDQFWSAI